MKIENKTLDQERALYNLMDSVVENCTFDGPADGESALKECRNVQLNNCTFALRYPLWHTDNFAINNSVMTESCRAPMWYNNGGNLANSKLHGLKALRESKNITLKNCDVNSAEFGWKCQNISLEDCKLNAQYLFLLSDNITLERVHMTGKYSFQYITNSTITNSVLDTKDAFWHADGVTVTNCVVKGEYLGWYSKNLTFINCQIIGTQPLCYCQNLTLKNCTMTDCDLSFEYSDVQAQIEGHITSVKNVKSGKIVATSIGEIIKENSIVETTCEIITKQ